MEQKAEMCRSRVECLLRATVPRCRRKQKGRLISQAEVDPRWAKPRSASTLKHWSTVFGERKIDESLPGSPLDRNILSNARKKAFLPLEILLMF